MASQVDVAPGETVGLHLRSLSRQRLLDEVFRKVVKNGALQPTEETAKPDGIERRYVALVVDRITLRMITAVCDLNDLLEEGLCLIELIDNAERKSVQVLEAVYFLLPTEANLQQIVDDAAEDGGKGKYKSFHVFFTHRVSDDLMSILANSADAVRLISSFAEVNLGFITCDARCFHIGDQTAFPDLFRGDSALVPVSQAAAGLSTVLASLGVLQPKIRVQCGPMTNAASRLGLELRSRLDEIQSKGTLFKPSTIPEGPHTVVIMERSFDWPVVLAHDLHYEAAMYDLLGSTCISVEDSVYTSAEGKAVNLGDEADALWQEYRHVPLWEVNDLVVQQVSKWTRQDREMQTKTAAAATSSNVASMATNAMNALQSLPNHKAIFAKLSVHSDISNRVYKLLEDAKLVDVGAFEQELLTGIDSNGKELIPRKIEKELNNYLTDPDVPNDVKQRLLMLFCASDNALEEAGRDADKIKAFASRLPKEDREVVTSSLWLQTAAVAPETNEAAARKREFYRKKVKGIKSTISAKLTRWQPKIREVMENASKHCLSFESFPELGSDPEIKRKTMPAAPAAGLVIVYVVGGMTMTEARQAHEVSNSLGVDVLVGGDCIITAKTLTDVLRQKLEEGVFAPQGEEEPGLLAGVMESVDAAMNDAQSKAQETKDNASTGMALGMFGSRFGFGK